MSSKLHWSDYLRIIPALAWTVFIVYALLAEPSSVPRFTWLDFPHADKIVHVGLFVIESGIICWAFCKQNWSYLIVGVLIWCALFGGGLELAQHYWVEGRSGEPMDFLADAFGAVIGMIVYSTISKYFRPLCGINRTLAS